MSHLTIALEKARHAQYAFVLNLLESFQEGADGDFVQKIDEAIRCLDAVYVSGGRITGGPIDGDPE